MLQGIDHLVVAVEDPEAIAGKLEAELGLRASEGGRHDLLGTFNRLVWLGDSYLELIGVFDWTLAETSWLGRPVVAKLATGGGLATWAVAIDDLDAQLRWTGNDASLTPPIVGERRRPDGRTVRWRLSHPASLSTVAPFLIEHDTGAAEWTTEERRERAVEGHPVGGAVRLVSLEIAVPAPASAAARLRSMIGTTAQPDGRRAVRVAIGAQSVRLVPVEREAPVAIVELAADVALRRRSVRIGDCEVRVRGAPVAPRLV